MTLKQLCLFDGEITMTRESTWIMFIVEISISRRKAFRHPARS